MASFDLTAQLQLQAPTNTNAVIGQIRRQLQGISVPIDIQANTQALSQASTQINNVAKSSKRASTEVEKFQKSLRSAINRFGAFAIGTRIIGGITSSLSRATTEAIKFEETFVKISQITGKNLGELSSLRNTITSLSTGLGVASSELLTVAKTLTQAGFSAQNTERALSVLAKTTLGSSFDDIINTTEGAIAVLNQFASQAAAAGDEVKFLETTLGAINAVSKRFAVEANDIVSAVRRVGGVFSSAGGSVEELIALFTSVRATTRESAETIATGLRTIFTRLQRDDTVDRLKQLGIELRTAEGLFVGPYEAIERLSRGLAGLDPRDFRFSEIVEELGGIRQIGKLIPLIQANVKAQQALNVARAGGDSINEDAEKTQGLLARRIRETSQSFNELVRKITESEGFKELANFGLAFANSLIQITDAITPLIPLLTKMIGTVLLLKGIKLGGSALGIGGLLRRNSGGKVYKFARGGFVPGSGNTDSVPAMLQPGEFVIKKSSAESLGASTLNAMNNNRFNKGGEQEKLSNKLAGKGVSGSFRLAGQKEAKIDAKAVIRAAGDNDGDNELDIGAAFMQPVGINRKTQAAIDPKPFYAAIKKDLGGSSQGKGGGVTDAAIKRSIGDLGSQVKIGITSGSLSQGTSTAFRGGLKNAIAQYSARFAKAEISKLPFNTGKFSRAYKKSNIEQIEGGVFEAFVSGLSDAPFDEAKIRANDKFDFPSGLGAAGSLFNVAGYMPSDAKRTFNEDSLVSLASKGSRYLVEGFRSEFAKSLQINNTAVAGTPIEAARLKAQQESAGRTSRLKPPQNRHFGGLIQKFEEGGEVASPKQLGFIQSLLKQYQTAVGSPHPSASSYGSPELEKFRASKVINNLKEAIAQKDILRKYLGKGVSYNVGYGDFVVAKQNAITPQIKLLSQFGGNEGAVLEWIQRGKASEGTALNPYQTKTGRRGYIGRSFQRRALGGLIQKFAAGGGVGTDTVPALLTPGEFVINKSASQSIGYGNLNSMNKTGVARFAAGGAVGVQKFNTGGAAQQSGGSLLGGLSKEVNSLSGSLQSMGFAIGLVSTVLLEAGKSSLGLSDEQAKAAQQAITTASAFALTVGSIGQLITSTTASTAAESANTAAESANTVAVVQNTAAQNSQLAALSGQLTATNADTAADVANTTATTGATTATATFGGVLSATTLVVTGLIAVFTYLSAEAQATADSLAKERDQNLENRKKEGSTSASSTEADLSQLEKTLRAQADARARGAATTAGMTGAAVGAAAGAGIGSGFAGVGAAPGAVIGSLVLGLAAYQTEYLAVSSELQAQVTETINSYKAMAESTSRTATAIGDLEKDFANAGKNIIPENATSEQRAAIEQKNREEQAAVVTKAAGERDGAGISQAISVLGPIAAKLGKSIEQLTQEDIQKGAESGVFSSGDISEGEAGAASIALAKLRTETELNSKVQEKAAAIIDESARKELDGSKSFDDIVRGNSAFAQNLRASTSAMAQERDSRLAQIDEQIKNAKSIDEGRKLGEQRNKIEQSYNEQIEQTVSGYRELNEAAAENVRRAAEEAAARAALIKELQSWRGFDSAIKAATYSLAEMSQSADNIGAIFGGGSQDFTKLAPEDLSDFSAVTDPDVKSAQAQSIGQGLGPAGQILADKVSDTAEAVSFAQKALENFQLTPEQKADPDKLLSDLGFDALNIAPAARKIIAQQLGELAASGKPLDLNTVNQIISPLIEEGQAGADRLAQLNEIRNKEVQLSAKFASQLEAQRAKVVSVFDKLVDVQLSNNEFLASIGARPEVTRQEKELARTTKAQFALNQSGAGTQAGDVQGNALVLRQAQARKASLQSDIDSGRISREQASVEQERLNTVINSTTNELSRLADQSDRLSDIQDQYGKALAKREALQKIGEDVVFGGESQREQIGMGFAGVAAAQQSGTVQNQSEEQRAATLSMLDRLGDNTINGEKASDLKERIVIGDLQKMGATEDQAKSLYQASQEEKSLQEEAKQIAEKREAAAAALLDQEVKNTTTMVNLQNQQLQQLQQINASLQGRAVNAAMGGGMPQAPLPQGRAIGGRIFASRGTDTVPAMLTPGEFVMSRQAVNRIGVNNLAAMNGGKRKASVVGGVNYAYEGGQSSGASGGMNFDNMIAAMNNLASKLDSIANMAITHTHNVTVDGLISLGGLNIDSIVQAIGQSIGRLVAGEVARQLGGKSTDFNAGT